jgi:hypothetical protein
MPGYHLQRIPVGEFGEPSKIQEELIELVDSFAQGNTVMALQELADIYGALRGVLNKYFPGFTMEKLEIMADATARAFKDGTRKAKK